MIEYQTVLQACTNVGFPIAVTVFLLIERNRATKELRVAINELTLLIKTKLK